MSYIKDELLIKSCIKYIDEDKIVEFLTSIEFDFTNKDASKYILHSSNTKLIELCIDSYSQGNNFNNLLDILDDNTSKTTFMLIKNKLVKQKNPDIIYKILKSNLVTWNKNPFIVGYFDIDNSVSNESILTQNEVNVLFYIYAKHENWLEREGGNNYAKDKEAIAKYYEECGAYLLMNGYLDIEYATEEAGEDFVKDYFDGNVPSGVRPNIYADIMIKSGMWYVCN